MNYDMVLAAPQHISHLPEIENAAGELFPIEDLPEPLRSLDRSMQDFEHAQQNDLLWVAVDQADIPFAFLLAEIVDGDFHIAEFDVHPRYGRKGIGSRLLHFVMNAAAQRGFQAVTLTTFEHLPWNAPFYAKHGFEILTPDQIESGLAQVLEHESALGLKRRVAMKVKLNLFP